MAKKILFTTIIILVVLFDVFLIGVAFYQALENKNIDSKSIEDNHQLSKELVRMP